MRADLNIPRKANRVLNLILLAFVLILIRVWYLSFVQHEEHVKQARKPQRKTVVEKMERATIRDRFNIPLAQNKIQYNAALRYADLREIPAYQWKKNEDGKKIKEPVRSVYINKLAETLSRELHMDKQMIEDIIYAKASLFPHTPFVIKENLTEKEYYRLRMLEKDFPGMEAQRVSRRIYPQGKTACDIVGYMGAIGQKEYLNIAQEIKELENYIRRRESGEIVFLPPNYNDPIEVRTRLKQLQERAYTIHDLIGKSGIENTYDETLRGFHGKTMYEIDPKGNILRQLPGSKKGISGQRVFLSISAELQQYAEELLAGHEGVRDATDSDGNYLPRKPWIKGGAIVAMDPKTGDVLALASYPRFDPNDFIPTQDAVQRKQKQSTIARWIENETHVGEVWDGKQQLKRERCQTSTHTWKEESIPFTWEYFLSTILSPGSTALAAINQIDNLEKAYSLQKSIECLLQLTEQTELAPLIETLFSSTDHTRCKKRISEEEKNLIESKLQDNAVQAHNLLNLVVSALSSIKHNDDKILILDLCKLLVDTRSFDDNLISLVGHTSLTHFHKLCQSLKIIHDEVQEEMQNLHHNLDFQKWRDTHFKQFLAQKRKEEKEKKKYALPYTEYLEKVEKALFKEFWQTCKYLFLDTFIHGQVRIETDKYPQLSPYLESLISLRKNLLCVDEANKLQNLLSSLSAVHAVQYMKTMRCFQELNRPLYGKYRSLRNTKGQQLEKHLAAAFYPLSGFGYERSQAFRQSTPAGSVFKIVVSYEALKHRYQYLKENRLSLNDLNPLTILDQMHLDKTGHAKQILGYTLDGQTIHRLYKGGILPRSHPNIGKIGIFDAIEQSSNIYFSLLAAEHIEDPSFLERACLEMGYGIKTGIDLSGEIKGNIPDDLAENKTGLYSFAIGQHSLIVTPLQTAVMLSAIANKGFILKPNIVHLTAGKQNIAHEITSLYQSTFPYQDSLGLVGIDFPLFTETLASPLAPLVHPTQPQVRNQLFLPPEIRYTLLEGMKRVISGSRGTARPSIVRYLFDNESSYRMYENLKHRLVGKTGTAEILYKPWLNQESKGKIHNHIWFAGVAFSEEDGRTVGKWEDPELTIVVYLRYSQAGGREAAPLAIQMIQKWKELKQKYGQESYLSIPDEKPTAQNTQ